MLRSIVAADALVLHHQSISIQNTDPMYLQTSNISRTWVGNKIADHSDVFGAPPVGAAPATSSFST